MHKIQKRAEIPQWRKHWKVEQIYKNTGEITDEKLKTHILNTNCIQDMVSSTNPMTNRNHAPREKHNAIWVQTRNINNRSIHELEQYIQENDAASRIILMDLSGIPDAINRTQFEAALRKKESPLETIVQITQWHQNKALCAKYQGKYGALQKTMMVCSEARI